LIISVNRFERKKNIQLAIHAFKMYEGMTTQGGTRRMALSHRGGMREGRGRQEGWEVRCCKRRRREEGGEDEGGRMKAEDGRGQRREERGGRIEEGGAAKLKFFVD
jgi:hypothetical protein